MKPHHNQYKKSLKYNELLKVFILPKEYYIALEKVNISLSGYAEKNKIYIANKERAMILTIRHRRNRMINRIRKKISRFKINDRQYIKGNKRYKARSNKIYGRKKKYKREGR